MAHTFPLLRLRPSAPRAGRFFRQGYRSIRREGVHGGQPSGIAPSGRGRASTNAAHRSRHFSRPGRVRWGSMADRPRGDFPGNDQGIPHLGRTTGGGSTFLWPNGFRGPRFVHAKRFVFPGSRTWTCPRRNPQSTTAVTRRARRERDAEQRFPLRSTNFTSTPRWCSSRRIEGTPWDRAKGCYPWINTKGEAPGGFLVNSRNPQ